MVKSTWVRLNKSIIREKTAGKPGVTHMELVRGMWGLREWKESVIRDLLDERQLICEHRGRGRPRRYFVQDNSTNAHGRIR